MAKHGPVLKAGKNAAGQTVEVRSKLDDEGNIIGYAVLVDGQEVDSATSEADAFRLADALIVPPPPSPRGFP